MKNPLLKNGTGIAVLLKVCLLLGSLFVAPVTAIAANADFSWIPNSEPGVVGYKVYYGTQSGGVYPNFVDIKSNTPDPSDGRMHGAVVGLENGVTYYFVCMAYDDLGNESAFSSEISYDSTAVPIIKTIQIK